MFLVFYQLELGICLPKVPFEHPSHFICNFKKRLAFLSSRLNNSSLFFLSFSYFKQNCVLDLNLLSHSMAEWESYAFQQNVKIVVNIELYICSLLARMVEFYSEWQFVVGDVYRLHCIYWTLININPKRVHKMTSEVYCVAASVVRCYKDCAVFMLVCYYYLYYHSLLVFFTCISRAQTMHLGHQSLESIFLFRY